MRKHVYAICKQQMRRSACAYGYAFVIHCLESIIPIVAISKISRLEIASVTEQAGLCLTWS